MDILDTIIAQKRKEVTLSKKHLAVSDLEASSLFKLKMASFFEALGKPGPSIIGEFKRN